MNQMMKEIPLLLIFNTTIDILLGPYNTSDYPITIVVVPLINIFVPLLSPYFY